jgi:hypothetical protein
MTGIVVTLTDFSICHGVLCLGWRAKFFNHVMRKKDRY